jgi:hypothetical protein
MLEDYAVTQFSECAYFPSESIIGKTNRKCRELKTTLHQNSIFHQVCLEIIASRRDYSFIDNAACRTPHDDSGNHIHFII